MQAMTIRALAAAVGGTIAGPFAPEVPTVTEVCIDSRAVTEGSVYFPLRGERFDGHDFLGDALSKGAAGCLTARELPSYRADRFYIRVPDVRLALAALARHFLKAANIPVIGITGSVGKTTAKEMVFAVLSERFHVLRTEGNLNNDIGLPLTLLNLTPEHELCVLEMGTNHFGEIDYLASIAPPDTAILTNIGDCHIEFLGSREGILQAKSELFPHMAPNSYAILNGDDPLLAPLRGTLPMQTVLCGTGRGLEYTAEGIQEDGDGCIKCKVITPHTKIDAVIPALGAHMIYPALFAAAAGERYGMTGEEIARGIARFTPGAMRMNVLDLPRGMRVLDDAYNANPQSMRAALDVLKGGLYTRRIAVLGDMFELGAQAEALHAQVGTYAAEVPVHCLVAIGPLARHIADAAQAAGCREVCWFPVVDDALAALSAMVGPDTVFLVKASRGMAFERIVAHLKEKAEDAGS